MSTMFIPLLAMLALVIFMQRGQRKQAQQRQDELNSLAKGDEVVTIGGLFGLIDEIDTDKQTVVLDVDGIYLTFELSAIKRRVTAAADLATVKEPAEEVAALETVDAVEEEQSAISE